MGKQPTEVEVQIQGLSAEGLGQAEHNERGLWVRNALPGEKVNARIVRRRRREQFADGALIENPNPQRVESACRYFPRCGGCAMQHLSAQAQLQHKQDQLVEHLSAAEVVAQKWRTPTSLQRLGYRRKARLGVRQVGEQMLIGFRESFSNRVARMDYCQTLTPRLAQLIAPLKSVIARMSEPDSFPQIEMAEGDDSVALLIRHLHPLTDTDHQHWVEFEQRFNTSVLLQSAGYDSLEDLRGSRELKPLSYQIPEYGLSMMFKPHQFTQVNATMNRELIRTALGYLGDMRGKVVLDLFCGVGNFTLPLARSGARAIGIEGSEDAVSMAKANAQLNQVGDKTGFFVADLYKDMDEQQRAQAREAMDQFGHPPQALLLDPPRSGAGANLAWWVSQLEVAKIVYVSCNPATFALDAQILNDLGYVLTEVGVYDMFPGTAHVETMGLFERAH